MSVELNDGAFAREIAAARTFGFTEEIEALRKANLIRGGSLDNAIVLTPDGMLNQTGLRFKDEFVRHKILDIIGGRNRLSVAVRGGVAEHHLENQLGQAPAVNAVERLDIDAMHYFDVTLADGKQLRVECKNASPKTSANGEYKVEVKSEGINVVGNAAPQTRQYRASRSWRSVLHVRHRTRRGCGESAFCAIPKKSVIPESMSTTMKMRPNCVSMVM